MKNIKKIGSPNFIHLFIASAGLLLGVVVYPIIAEATVYFSDGFESGNFSSWTNSTGVWEVETGGGSYHGSKRAEAQGNTGSTDDILEKNISTAGLNDLKLSYWYKIAAGLETSDYVVLEWSTDGSVWYVIDSYSGINTTGNYVKAEHALPDEVNDNAGFRFRFRARLSSNSDVFRLDDVSLESIAPPSPALCADGLDNDSDGKIDAEDSGCESPTDNDETDVIPPTDLCANIEGVQETVPEGLVQDGPDCVEPPPPPPTDVCPNLEGLQETVPMGYHLSEGQCVEDTPPPPPPALCADGLDNDSDGKIDAEDPGCEDSDDGDEMNQNPPSPPTPPGPPTPPPGNGPILGTLVFSTGSPVSPTGTGSNGRVLGESICSAEYLNEYIRPGANNNPEEVKKLQIFLNEHLGLNLALTGIYDPKTIAAVRRFQVMYSGDVLLPWVVVGLHNDENTPTGFVYKTTKRKINLIKCPGLDIPLPVLK